MVEPTYLFTFSPRPSYCAPCCPLAEKIIALLCQVFQWFMGRMLSFHPVTLSQPLQSSLLSSLFRREILKILQGKYQETKPGSFLITPSDVKCLGQEILMAGAQLENRPEKHKKIARVPTHYDSEAHKALPHPHPIHFTSTSLLYLSFSPF